jgi:hypothetical protein
MQQSVSAFTMLLLLGIILFMGTSVAVGSTSQVERSTTDSIKISINDSRHGTDTSTTQINVQSDTSSPVPGNLQRFTGNDDSIGNLDVLAAVQAANDGTQIDGQPVGNIDVLNVVQFVNKNP